MEWRRDFTAVLAAERARHLVELDLVRADLIATQERLACLAAAMMANHDQLLALIPAATDRPSWDQRDATPIADIGDAAKEVMSAFGHTMASAPV